MNTFKNGKGVNIGTSWTTVYTCPAGTTAVVIGMTISNKLAVAITINGRMRDNDDAGTYVGILGTDTPIDPGSAIVPYGGAQKMVLEENDRIEVISSDVDSVDVAISVLEIS